jgi:hypothetical protein
MTRRALLALAVSSAVAVALSPLVAAARGARVAWHERRGSGRRRMRG